MIRSAPYRTSVATRLACAGASLALSGTLMATLLGMFDQASPRQWLQPTPGLMAQTSRCDAIAARAVRLRCTQEVVAAIRADAPEVIVVARLP